MVIVKMVFVCLGFLLNLFFKEQYSILPLLSSHFVTDIMAKTSVETCDKMLLGIQSEKKVA